jgi:phosphatidylserine decarboxylase
MVVLFCSLRSSRALIPVEIILALLLVWMFSFFRDPDRRVLRDEKVLLSPADGKVTDIEMVDDESILGEKAMRIGIFLSVFNVHINRVPSSVKIEKITYKKGAFKNAMSAESGRVNESNDVLMTRLAEPQDKLLVRQISGAIARRIVCEAKPGESFDQGAQFGMINFGSRTELYFPAAEKTRVTVKIGDKVKAGLTPLVRYE